MILSAQAVSVHAAPPTPVQQAFTDAQTLANGAVAGAATGVTNGTVQSTVNSFNPTYYSYSNTAPETALFMGGNGDTFTAGTAKITACQTGAANPDAFRQQNCDAINFMAKNPSTRPQFTISPTDTNIAASKAIEKNASTLAEKSLGFVNPNAVGSFTGCASKTTTTPPTYGIEVCYDAATATSQMCTIGRTVVVNANTDYQCNKTANVYGTQTCSRTAVVTIPGAIPATQVASCGSGYTLSGTNCTAPATASNPNYSCNSGTLSGTQCYQPAYQPPGVTATTTFACATMQVQQTVPGGTFTGNYIYRTSPDLTICAPVAGPTPCPGINGASVKTTVAGPYAWVTACVIGVTSVVRGKQKITVWSGNAGVSAGTCQPGTTLGSTFGGFVCTAPQIYSCPSGYTLSGTTCYPPMVTPPPTPATISSYSCPAGSVLSANGTTCAPTTAATVSYTCGTGMTLSGTTCQPDPLVSWQDGCSALEMLAK